jgi:hypothetical protein
MPTPAKTPVPVPVPNVRGGLPGIDAGTSAFANANADVPQMKRQCQCKCRTIANRSAKAAGIAKTIANGTANIFATASKNTHAVANALANWYLCAFALALRQLGMPIGNANCKCQLQKTIANDNCECSASHPDWLPGLPLMGSWVSWLRRFHRHSTGCAVAMAFELAFAIAMII